MLTFNKLRDLFHMQQLLNKVLEMSERIADRLGRRLVFMEVCGTHTVSISSSGIRSLVGEKIELRSGPGCPVCVTSSIDLDRMIALAQIPQVVVATFGDMVRVPGTNSSLEKERAYGGAVQVVYSPMEAVKMAIINPQKEFVLIGAGFETTTPLMGLCIREAQKDHLDNFSMLSLHKRVPPALKTLLLDNELYLDGLLLPGHVCTVTGVRAFNFIARDYGIPAVVAGFESMDILGSILVLLEMIEQKTPQVVNGYHGVVKDKGNTEAQKVIDAYFQVDDARWRGLGVIPESGYYLKKNIEKFDAVKKFSIEVKNSPENTSCRCGELMKGMITPLDCQLFGTDCTPAHPLGPCMVSSEGVCSAYYRYEHYDS